MENLNNNFSNSDNLLGSKENLKFLKNELDNSKQILDKLLTEKETFNPKSKEISEHKVTENLHGVSNDNNNFKEDEKQNKSRKHDIDSCKKTLILNIWKYLHNNILLKSDIGNKTSKKNKVIMQISKKLELEMMKKTALELYEEYYNIKEKYFFKKLIKEKKFETELNEALSKRFEEYFVEYRESEDFFKDAIKSCKKDSLKLNRYLLLARRYKNYLLKSTKVSVENIEDDEGLSDKFIQKCNELIPNNESNNNITKNSTNSQNNNLNVQFSSPKKEGIDENNFDKNEINLKNKGKDSTAEELIELIENLPIEEQEKVNDHILQKITKNESICPKNKDSPEPNKIFQLDPDSFFNIKDSPEPNIPDSD